jgi:asparagine synthase (glutamine-hydrolysing)
MCGICGKLNFDGRPVGETLIRRMEDVLFHRGPNGRGSYVQGPIGLGHRRLSIIDLSSGDQPMSNEDGSIWIVFNGEIYNFPELTRELQARGHRFKSRSDTEAIVHLYEEYGVDCVKRLRGMFAFALWDGRERRLLLARDRVGKKPLFYRLAADSLAFASEIKAILQDPTVPREMNVQAMHDYLTYQYVPPPATIFKGINKLPPAHTLVWEQGQVRIERYWDLYYTPKLKLSEEEAGQRLRELLRQAVRMRLMSEVPLGALLSGGIDSSFVVAIMAEMMDQPVKTFSIGFAERDFNELPYARIVAERFATDHHEFIVRPDALAVLPELIWHCDEPFADSSALPTYYVSKITRQHVTVALNGDGGDESFAGYLRYLGFRIVQLYQLLPRPLRERAIGGILAALPSLSVRPGFWHRLARLNEISLAPAAELYAQSITIFNKDRKFALYSPALQDELRGQNSLDYMFHYFGNDHATELVDQMLYSDIMTYLPGALLVKMDRMTMAHSLEGRSPFLDHELMEFAASLPADFKLRGRTLKYLLKRAGEGILPQEILHRGKQGFGVPLNYWFRGELRDFLQEVFAAPRLVAEGYFNGESLTRILREHIEGRADHSYRIWTLLCLELWYRMFMDNTLSPPSHSSGD